METGLDIVQKRPKRLPIERLTLWRVSLRLNMEVARGKISKIKGLPHHARGRVEHRSVPDFLSHHPNMFNRIAWLCCLNNTAKILDQLEYGTDLHSRYLVPIHYG